MDEGTGDQGNQWNVYLFESRDEYEIHNTNDECFNQDSSDRSRHLI